MHKPYGLFCYLLLKSINFCERRERERKKTKEQWVEAGTQQPLYEHLHVCMCPCLHGSFFSASRPYHFCLAFMCYSILKWEWSQQHYWQFIDYVPGKKYWLWLALVRERGFLDLCTYCIRHYNNLDLAYISWKASSKVFFGWCFAILACVY